MGVLLPPQHGFFKFQLLVPETRLLFMPHLLLHHHKRLVLLLLRGIFAGERVHLPLSPSEFLPAFPPFLDGLDLGLLVVLPLRVDALDGADLQDGPSVIRVVGFFSRVFRVIVIVIFLQLPLPVFRVQLEFLLALPGLDSLEVLLGENVSAGADFLRLFHAFFDGVDVQLGICGALGRMKEC